MLEKRSFCFKLALWKIQNQTGCTVVSGMSLLGVDPEAPELPEVPNSWLLRVMTDNVGVVPLALVVDDFLRTVTILHDRLIPLHPKTVQRYSAIERQVWDLLARCLEAAPDFTDGFPNLAQKLNAFFLQRHDLRLEVLASLQAAIK